MTDKIVFKVGDVFPENDLRGRFIVLLAMILNDLNRLHAPMLETIESPEKEPRIPLGSLFRDLCSKYLEGVDAIRLAIELPEIGAFIAELPEEADQDFRQFQDTFAPKEGSLTEEVLKGIRNHTFHYPKIQNPMFGKALQSLKDEQSSIRFWGDRIRDIDFPIADEVGCQVVFGEAFSTREDLKASLQRLQQGVNGLHGFVRHAMDYYFATIPREKLQVEKSKR